MCIIFWGSGLNSKFPFVLASNRDEFYARPTRPASFWRPQGTAAEVGTVILSGLDLQVGTGEPRSTASSSSSGKDYGVPDLPPSGVSEDGGCSARGTWIGVSTGGKLSALTNYREPFRPRDKSLSRGLLVGNFLSRAPSPREYARTIARNAGSGVEEGASDDVDVTRMAGFNLLCFDLRALLRDFREGNGAAGDGSGRGGDSAVYITNRFSDAPSAGTAPDSPPRYRVDFQYPAEPRRIYGLSNALMDDCTWPKVANGKRRFEQIVSAEVSDCRGDGATVQEEQRLLKELFTLMSDEDPFSVSNPPKVLTDLAKCICVPAMTISGAAAVADYGTRSTCVILLAADGTCVFAERLFDGVKGDRNDERPKDAEDWRVFRFKIPVS